METPHNTSLNDHGQPQVVGFHSKQNKLKALLGLKGILEGLTADKCLVELEMLYLEAWLNYEPECKDGGDFDDIRYEIADILEDGVVSKDELSSLYNIVRDALDYDLKNPDTGDLSNNIFIGFLNGICADEVLMDNEIAKLGEILEEEPDFCLKFPGNMIKNRLEQILEDGVIDDEERLDLLELIKSVTGHRFIETGLAHGMAADFVTTKATMVNISSAKICFTGKFVSGTRKALQESASGLGAINQDKITQKLDLLVIGSLASRDWKFTSHGRKVEDVLSNRKKGIMTEIINEETWLEISSN